MPIPITPQVAYFSMEIAFEPDVPTYSGGLGVLAGDTLRSAADLQVPMVAVSLLHRKGYLRQILDPQGGQSEQQDVWNPLSHFESLGPCGSVNIEGRTVSIAVWRHHVQGVSGHKLPLYLLDTDLPANESFDRSLTDSLYGGDAHYRLCQEVLLGIGGLDVLDRLGLKDIRSYHMNEGHSALLALGLLELQLAGRQPSDDDIQAVRRRCVFTTHTPIPAGHDQFARDVAVQVLGESRVGCLEAAGGFHEGSLNMTYLALRFSHYVNGVAMHHGELSRSMYPDYPVRAITNGVHAATWTSPAFQTVFDRHIPEWRRDNLYLRYAVGISLEEISQAHIAAKKELLQTVHETTGRQLGEKTFTIGFARRATGYKRADLLLSDLDKLRWISRQIGPLQILYAGKAHPRDGSGKDAIRRIFRASEALRGVVDVVYLPNYDMHWARLLVAGSDLWLNTPQHPQEASGTSGMKAALNGVPSFSVMDGWWVEGHVEGVTGWAIGDEEAMGSAAEELASLYGKLEWTILPMYYGRPASYAEMMRSCIALNGSFFNTQRMIAQYVANAYGLLE